MPDYSEIADGELVEEYQYRNLRVRRGDPLRQVEAQAKAEGLAARRAAGSFARLAKFQRPSE